MDLTWLVTACFGLIVGTVLGGLGGGGSILVVPVLVYGLSVAPREATSLAHVLVGVTSGATALMHWQAGRFRWATALTLAAWGLPGAYLGRLTHRFVPEAVIMIALAVLMITVSVTLLRRGEGRAGTAEAQGGPPIAPRSPWARLAVTGLAGVGLGFLTGFLGVGGGFLIVPVLVVILRVPIKEAVGTSLGVIAFNCASSLLFADVSQLRWDLALPFLAGALTGGLLGARFVRRTDPQRLRRGFAWLVVALGALILVESLVAWTARMNQDRTGEPTSAELSSQPRSGG